MARTTSASAGRLPTALLIALVAGVVTPLIPIPQPEPEEILELPERVVRFIELVPRGRCRLRPSSRKSKPEQPEPTPEPVLANEQTPEAPPPVDAPAPAPEPAPRQRAEAAGLLAFRESLADDCRKADRRADRLGD